MSPEISYPYRPIKMTVRNAGQATMEYVLFLVITVGIIVGLATAFFQPLGDYFNNYMGNYVGCLLEAGELPSLGSDQQTSVEDGECNSKFEPATLAAGRPYTASGASAAAEDAKRNGPSRENSGNSSGSSGYGGSAPKTAGGINGGSPPKSRNADGSSKDPKVVEFSIGGTPEGGFYKPRNGSSSASRSNASGGQGIITYGLTEGGAKTTTIERSGSSRVIASDLAPNAAKKFAVKPPPAKKTADDDGGQETAFGIGDFFRYLIIAAIIILLIALFGGQAAKLSKSWE